MSIELIAVFVLSGLLVVVLSAYDRLLRELKRTRFEREEIENRARHRASRIIEEARDKALRVLQEVQLDATQEKELLKTGLNHVTEIQLSNYNSKLQTITKDIEDDIRKEASEFKRALEMETVGAEKAVAARIEEDYTKAKQEVEAYKAAKLARVDENITQMLKAVSLEVVGKSLSFENHAELVTKCLEEAKRDHVI